MTTQEMKEKCKKFFEELSEKLKDSHIIVQSCNKDESAYLVPIGTENEITYFGKPVNSFRISDHWNWYTNLQKNPDPNYVQCENVDLKHARKREMYGKASKPIFAWSVAIYGPDLKYHTMMGEFYNFKEKKWDWVDFEDLDEWVKIFKQKSA